MPPVNIIFAITAPLSSYIDELKAATISPATNNAAITNGCTCDCRSCSYILHTCFANRKYGALPISPRTMRNNRDRVSGRLIHYRITAEFLTGTWVIRLTHWGWGQECKTIYWSDFPRHFGRQKINFSC